MKGAAERIEPTEFSNQELEKLREALMEKERPRLVGREGYELELPDPIFHFLLRIVQGMRKGKTMLLMPEDEAFTTQAAADYLGVSRPYLVKLLLQGEIPFFSAGSHRKVKLSDLREYEAKRAQIRRESLDEMTREAHQADLYDNEQED